MIPVWLPYALMAAGAAANYAGQKKSQREAQRRTSAELERQRRFREESEKNLKNVREDIAKTPENIEKEQAALEQDYVAAQAPAQDQTGSLIAMAEDAPAEVQSYRQEAMGKASEGAQAEAKRLAALSGYGQNLFGTNMSLADLAKEIGMVNQASRGSLTALDQELIDAANAGNNLATLGSILSAAGMVTGMGAGMGAGAAGAGAGAGTGAGATFSGTMSSAPQWIAPVFSMANTSGYGPNPGMNFGTRY